MRGALAGAGAAALAAPAAYATEAVTWKLQSTWPSKDIFHEYAQDLARKVNDMAGGRLKIDVLPAGAVVPPFQLLEAVSKGTLDAGHGVIAYHYGKNSALALWGSGPAFGMDPNMVLAWHNYGGGKDLLDEIYKSLNMNVVSLLYGPMPCQPLGWFRKPVAKVEDMKGLKFRTVGLAVDVFNDMGVAVNPLPGCEIVPALDRGLIDAAEFNNASSDRVLGFADVAKNCMLQSFHQSGEQFEVLINRSKFDALPKELQALIEYATPAASSDMSWMAIDRNSKDYEALKKDGVKFHKTPDAILRRQLEAWDRTIEKRTIHRVLDHARRHRRRTRAVSPAAERHALPDLQDAARKLLSARRDDPRRAGLHRVRPRDAHRSGRHRRLWRLHPGRGLRQLNLGMVRESVYLTAKTSAMVCWLFVGSAIFSAAFALLGGQEIVERWVLSMNLSKVEFMLLSQIIIFVLGWPLEWTEIIVIFMPIFVPLLDKFGVDPLFFGLLVALNLQTAFLSPPVAMSAFYLKGVAPKHVTLNEIFRGMIPFMGIQILAIVLLYVFPEIGLWLPKVLYGR